MLSGFDVSHWQGIFNFAGMAAKGHKFCFIKATEGASYIDKEFKRSWNEAPRHGLLTGAYHFYRPKFDPMSQAAHFISTLGATRVGDLPCVLDLETTDGQRPSVIAAGVIRWCETVRVYTGKSPIIYGSPGFFHPLGTLEGFNNYPLWVAHYGVEKPSIPYPWNAYTFWQYTDKGGIDLNVFNGDLAQLRALAKIT